LLAAQENSGIFPYQPMLFCPCLENQTTINYLREAMGKRLASLVVLLVFGCLALAAQDSKDGKPKCLTCHGPFDKLVKAPAALKTANDGTVNPHKYIPHDSQDVPQCTECHLVPHEIPLKDKASVVKPKDISYCYDACHHQRNLQLCKSCH
jgi:hypothetical protein